MGLFSKKKIICERCGKEYEARITLGNHICDACILQMAEKENRIKGYVEYARKMHWEPYTEEQLEKIARHRDAILEKYRMTEGISRTELKIASDSYKALTDEQAANVLIRMGNSSIASTMGASYSEHFFVPTAFEKTIVDAEDVIAVGYTKDRRFDHDSYEMILCAVFTADPYLPAFPMVYVGKLGFFEIMKSKKGRQGVEDLFTSLCPNLKYPVLDLKKLKKILDLNDTMNGRVNPRFILEQISDAVDGMGVFNTKHMSEELSQDTAEMMDAYGYIQDVEVNQILKLDKMFNKMYWQKQIKRLADYDI